MTPLESRLKELKAVAAAGTQKWKDEGEWFHDHRVGFPLHRHGENDENDAQHIATFNPAMVTSLLEALEEMVKALEGFRKFCIHPECHCFACESLPRIEKKVCG